MDPGVFPDSRREPLAPWDASSFAASHGDRPPDIMPRELRQVIDGQMSSTDPLFWIILVSKRDPRKISIKAASPDMLGCSAFHPLIRCARIYCIILDGSRHSTTTKRIFKATTHPYCNTH
jgi:hypothetical protein